MIIPLLLETYLKEVVIASVYGRVVYGPKWRQFVLLAGDAVAEDCWLGIFSGNQHHSYVVMFILFAAGLE